MRFDIEHLSQKEETNHNPICYIKTILFFTTDKDWVQRLSEALVKITFNGFVGKQKGDLRSVSENQIALGAFITPYTINPILEINRLYTPDTFLSKKLPKMEYWETRIELNNFQFRDNEYLEIIFGDHLKLSEVENVIPEIERLKTMLGKFSSSTQDLLRMIPFFRLDWALDSDPFSAEFNIGLTKPIILTGLSAPNPDNLRKQMIVENNILASQLVKTFMIDKSLTQTFIKEFHKKIIVEGGEYRTIDVKIEDNFNDITKAFVKPSDIEASMQLLVKWYNDRAKTDVPNKIHPLIFSTIFHHYLLQVHPFTDGNGRLARVLCSLILLSYNFPPPIFSKEQRQEYLTNLRYADRGNMNPLIAFIGNGIIQSINNALIAKHDFYG